MRRRARTPAVRIGRWPKIFFALWILGLGLFFGMNYRKIQRPESSSEAAADSPISPNPSNMNSPDPEPQPKDSPPDEYANPKAATPAARPGLGLAAAAASLLPAAAGLGAGGPENALVLVNADSWASTCIANEYVSARHIPPANVITLRNLPDFEQMTVEDFRTLILQPALRTAEQRGIGPQIDYVLYSADFPTAIDVRTDLIGKQLPRVITQPAAINGLTYLYGLTMAKNMNYLGLNVNFYHRQSIRSMGDGQWPDEDKKSYAEAVALMQKKIAENSKEPGTPPPGQPDAPKPSPAVESELQPVLEKLLELKAKHPTHTELLYNIACVQARLGKPEAAVDSLRKAVDNGWWDMRLAEMDPDLGSIRGRQDFSLLVLRAKMAKFEVLPTSGFRGAIGWLPTGQPVPGTQGVRYLLSTMLAYTSGRGNSVREAVTNLQRSIGADGTRPKGTIYFMENRDVRSTTREWGFRRSAEKLRDAGVASSVEEGVLPKNKTDVAGVTIGTAQFDWPASGSRLLPGAICDNLTSTSGEMAENAGQTPLTDFIRAGAGGASGTVTEPFAIQAKFPDPFIHYHYAQGCSLAEAFYQSLAGPYQILIVGDALCTPWRRDLTVQPGDLTAGATLKGMLRITPSATSRDRIAAGVFELYLDGRRVASVQAGGTLELDTARVMDGQHEIAVVANGSDPVSTRGTIRLPVTILNGDAKVRAEGPTGSVPWDKPVQLTASVPGAKSFIFFHNTDEVGRITGDTGSVQVDPRILGQGPIRIYPVAVLGDTKQILGAPIDFRVTPPTALPALRSSSQIVLADGFTVTPAGGKKTIVQESTGDWLAKAGVANGGAFTIDAWFTVSADDVYQFQFRGPADLRLSVDGKPQDWPRGTGWRFIPVHLAPGRHLLRIDGKADSPPRLDVRFGGPGTQRLDGKRFRHPEAG